MGVRIRSTLYSMLWHLGQGEMPDWLNGHGGEVGWRKGTHRGVQFLDKIHIGEKQRRDVFNRKFTIRYNQAFDEVVRHCADLGREGKTWITPEVAEGYRVLHRAGFAHSFECWQGDKLVGGCFGIQIGAWISVDSMYHHVSNASKAAYGQTLVRLKERGFTFVDVNVVSKHMEYFGAEWVPQWRFDQMIRQAMALSPTLDEGIPARSLPALIRRGLPLARIAGGLLRRLRPATKSAPQKQPVAQAPAGEKEELVQVGADA